MGGKPSIRRWRVTAYGAVLCLLAAAFAIEAKLAWFSPQGSPRAQIAAVKLLPTEAPRLIQQAQTSDARQAHVPAEAPLIPHLALFAATVIAAAPRPVDGRTFCPSPGIAPALFSRPPPHF
jgi:hypothetical protein